MRERVLGQIERKDYRWNDLKRIVQIVDLDGAFVPDSLVEKSDTERLRYTEDRIMASSADNIRERNRAKKNALRKLSHLGNLTFRRHSVPFSVYYLSRNMEHALHGRIDEVEVGEKERLARDFQRRFRNDLPGFVGFMNGSDVAVPGTYEETWKYVEEGCNSLKRGSNLHLVLGDGFRL